jgi:hypothetical protein
MTVGDVILTSVLGPPKFIRGTFDVDDLSTSSWWNMTSPSQNDGLVCYKLKHLTGETFIGINTMGSVMLSRDSGRNWRLIFITSFIMNSLAVGNGYAFIGTGAGIFRSRDGETWTLLPGSPKSISLLLLTCIQNIAAFPDGKVMVTMGSKFYRSYNSGDTWQEVHSPFRGSPYDWLDNGGNPGKASFALAGKSSNYIIASMGSALWLTEDFGDTWTKIIEWNSRYVPLGLLYTRDNTFILKIRYLGSGEEELVQVMVSHDNCLSFVHKFNQEADWDRQMEYLPASDTIVSAHVHNRSEGGHTPSILYSTDNGDHFSEKLIYPSFHGFCTNFGLIAICGCIHEPNKGLYLMDIIIKKVLEKPYRMGIRLKSQPIKNYTMDIQVKKQRTNTLSMDMLLKKTVTKPYQAKVRILKTVEISHTMDITIAQRIGKPYTIDMILKRIGHIVYRMSCPKRKTVTTEYGMGISIVGDYTKPLKRDVMLAFPQPFALEIENANYVLNQDITVQRLDEHGY